MEKSTSQKLAVEQKVRLTLIFLTIYLHSRVFCIIKCLLWINFTHSYNSKQRVLNLMSFWLWSYLHSHIRNHTNKCWLIFYGNNITDAYIYICFCMCQRTTKCLRILIMCSTHETPQHNPPLWDLIPKTIGFLLYKTTKLAVQIVLLSLLYIALSVDSPGLIHDPINFRINSVKIKIPFLVTQFSE